MHDKLALREFLELFLRWEMWVGGWEGGREREREGGREGERGGGREGERDPKVKSGHLAIRTPCYQDTLLSGHLAIRTPCYQDALLSGHLAIRTFLYVFKLIPCRNTSFSPHPCRHWMVF